MMMRFFNILTNIEKVIASVFTALLTAFVVFDVIAREFWKVGIPWAQKSAVYLMIWVGFLGAIIVTQKVGHLRPEVADKIWKGKSKIFYLRFHNFLVLIFTGTMTYYSWLYVQESRSFADRNIIIDIPMWVLQSIIPYTFFSMSLRYLFFTFFPQEKDPQSVH
jgi:TRAP-type C4-dicarboxylate transport system permease small subunit